jgi:hypothetical protein
VKQLFIASLAGEGVLCKGIAALSDPGPSFFYICLLMDYFASKDGLGCWVAFGNRLMQQILIPSTPS